MRPIEDQITDAMRRYVEREMKQISDGTRLNGQQFAEKLAAAMLSGMALTARFLAANEGHSVITPQRVERGVQEVATRCGFELGTLE